MPAKEAQLRRRAFAAASMIAAFWPLPWGVGYLFLKQWARFVVVLIWSTIGQVVLRGFLGPDSEVYMAILVGSFIIIIADTWRLAITVLRQPIAEPPHDKEG